jgi:hypothetical protein
VRRLEIHLFYENLGLAVVPVVVAIPLLATIASSVAAGRLPDVKNVPLTFQTIAAEVPAGVPVYTDSPWLLAWYGKRPAVWLPQRPSDIRDLIAHVPMKVGCLTSMLRGYSQSEDFGYWQTLYSGIRTPEGYEVVRWFYTEGSYIFAVPGLIPPLSRSDTGAPHPASPPVEGSE